MSRRKSAPSKTKRKATKSTTSVKNNLEKMFSEIPAKLATQFSKEVDGLRKVESKIKANLAKLKLQASKAKNRVKANSIAKAIATTTKQLEQTASSLAAAIQKNARVVALRKHLAVYKKDWASKVKAMKTKATSTTAKSKKSKTKKSNTKKSTANVITLPKTSMDSDSDMENTEQNKTAEMS